MRFFAVIDTNVIVSSLLSPLSDSATVLIRKHLLDGTIIPLFNEEILSEYRAVLARPKLGLPVNLATQIVNTITQTGFALERTVSPEAFSDPKDLVFYEVALSKEDAYLVTGNTKHFPQTPFVVTPAEMLAIIESTNTDTPAR